MVSIQVFFFGSIIGGVAGVWLGFTTLKYAIMANQEYLHARAIALVLLAIGFTVHTLGDYLVPVFGDAGEMILESIAHVILLIGFIIFLKSANSILASAEEHSFK